MSRRYWLIPLMIFALGGCAYFVAGLSEMTTKTVFKHDRTLASEIDSEERLLDAFRGDVGLAFFLHDQFNGTSVYHSLNGSDLSRKRLLLPYLSFESQQTKDHGRYLVAPDEKSVIKLTGSTAYIAQVQERIVGNFSFLFAPPPKKYMSPVTAQMSDWLQFRDGVYSLDGNAFFVYETVLQRQTNEVSRSTEIYTFAPKDKSIKKIPITNTTSLRLGTGNKIIAVDTGKGFILLTSTDNEEQTTYLNRIDIVRGLNNSFITIPKNSDPLVDPNMSNVYFVDQEKQEVFEVDMETTAVSSFVSFDDLDEEQRLLPELLYDRGRGIIYMQVASVDGVWLYRTDVRKPQKPIEFLPIGKCEGRAISRSGSYIFLACPDQDSTTRYELFDVISGEKTVVYRSTKSTVLELVGFE